MKNLIKKLIALIKSFEQFPHLNIVLAKHYRL